MRAAVALAASAVVCAVFGADDAHAVTAVLPVDAAGMDRDDARVRRDVTEVMKEILRADFRAVGDDVVKDGGARCAQSLACLQKAAQTSGADEVALFKAARATQTAERPDAWADVTLTVFSAEGAPLVTYATTLTTTTTINDLRGILVQAFQPQSYSGRVKVRGLVAGDELLLDGLRPDRSELPLRAGPHKARVHRKDGSVVEVAFVVPFNDEVVVDVPQAAPASSSVPGWPVYAYGGVAAAGVVGVVVVAVREFALFAPAARALADSACAAGVDDPSGGDFADQGTDPFATCTAVQVQAHQHVQLNRDLDASLGVGFAAVAVAGAAAVVADLVLTPPPGES